MADLPRLWVRHETRETERRAPIVPADARRLVEHGISVTVEESAKRRFPIDDYAAAGCRIATAGSWVDADADVVVVGLKELPDAPAELVHRHVFFGHAYKGQQGSRELLSRFTAGGGTLLDIEYLVDENGGRLVAFGYWAGYVGAALAVLHGRGRLEAPLVAHSRAALDEQLRVPPDEHLTAVVIGALGRCGRGAGDALQTAGITPTRWDIEETRVLDRRALLSHDILVNTVLATTPGSAFLTRADLDDRDRRLRVISDVSCDVSSACNVLPIYDRCTSWQHPVHRLRDGPPPLDLIAIDNLPSLLPAEASVAFSGELTPHLMVLGTGPPWRRSGEAFQLACRTADLDKESADA